MALAGGLPAALFSQGVFYWDDPEEFVPEQGHFPQSASGGGVAAVAWQELEADPSGGRGSVYVSVAVSRTDEADGETRWDTRRRVAGPYPYAGKAPWIYSLFVDRSGRVIFSIAASASRTEILVSADRGASFSAASARNGGADGAGEAESLAPRVFQTAGGGYLLFISRSVNQALTLYYARSKDALTWSPFELFTRDDPELALNFLPAHASLDGTEYVVFQSYRPAAERRMAFQLYLKTSADGGLTWSRARHLSAFAGTGGGPPDAAEAGLYNNERPHLTARAGSLFLVWERKYVTGAASIFALALDKNGEPLGRPEKVNGGAAACAAPQGIELDGRLYALWFDNRSGANAVIMAQKNGALWEERVISDAGRPSTFASPALARGTLYVFWQDSAAGRERIYYREQDRHVAGARPRALNFTSGAAVAGSVARVAWSAPRDPSGIAGFSWVWSRDAAAAPPAALNAGAETNAAELPAGADGPWYFTIVAVDGAGNRSPPETLAFVRDTTPPPPPVIMPFDEDASGFLASNSFYVEWREVEGADDTAGFYWALEELPPSLARDARGAEDGGWEARAAAFRAEKAAAPKALRNMGMRSRYFCDNLDDGLWRLSVYAIDRVGNVSEPARAHFRLDKYRERTFITGVSAEQDEQGALSLRLRGRGFLRGGAIRAVAFRRVGERAPEMTLPEGGGRFRVLSDRELYVPGVEHLKGGEYYVIVEHPLRGAAQSPEPVAAGRTQTVRHGDYSAAWKPSWDMRRGIVLSAPPLLVFLVAPLCALAAALAFRTARVIVREQRAIRVETLALLYGNRMPLEEKKLLARARRKRGITLRYKFTLFAASLVIFIVLILAIPLYYMMTVTQRDTLLGGLYDRAGVLLEALGTSARVFLPTSNVLELGFLPAQSASIPEARYVTITGYGRGATLDDDYVWASNDPGLHSKIDTAVFEPGVSRIRDRISPLLRDFEADLNARAAASAGALSRAVSDLNAESLALLGKTDAESLERLSDIQETVKELEDRVGGVLGVLNKEIRSEPPYTIENYLKTNTFILYKPILYRQGASDIYARGLVRIEISTETIRERLLEGQKSILRVILYVAFIALAIGFAGAFLLSAIIVRPINALVRHVEKIRDTEDKSKLEGSELRLKSRDELAALADTINDMTRGLVKAAIASQDLTMGKEIQKKFIPLEVDAGGGKKTSGFTKTPYARFFGYYEGAKGVSGDYFDYRDLDGRYFAVIKCDVAGKGIPAALIMIQVATMFISYFSEWKAGEKSMRIEELVYQINAFIEDMGFKGRFAAFTLCLYDSHTGLARFCNAGDNIIHLYDRSERKMRLVGLARTPAAGVLTNDIVRMGGGYRVETLVLDAGDILLLYTDGIEESKRGFRDALFKEIVCAHNGAPPDTPHENHVVGQWNEELGADRVEAVVNAVMNKSSYTLHKHHDPHGGDCYHFDFTSCGGSVEDAIMAMVSVEKVFRMYQNPAAGADARVLVDEKVDRFLKSHFVEYNRFCASQERFADGGNYLYYRGLCEDEQYDDLTILGIKRRQ